MGSQLVAARKLRQKLDLETLTQATQATRDTQATQATLIRPLRPLRLFRLLTTHNNEVDGDILLNIERLPL